jgi:hypothetical protein
MQSLVLLFYLLLFRALSLNMSAMREMMQVKKLSELAILPSRGSMYAAGERDFLHLRYCNIS